ncbi:hypothetical protein AZE42_08247 [Rhizopogon vesiculosus]|uniref:Uncharacterized protein n=1 Tax=Rhizopogon vesiculosus TaxID=180088 RepID=A0A1J8Q944_9AGAM|nr:hypothetical protein AZE42_08247 [Rhizopogon vesiculosus]
MTKYSKSTLSGSEPINTLGRQSNPWEVQAPAISSASATKTTAAFENDRYQSATGLIHLYDIASHQLLRALSTHKSMSISHLATMRKSSLIRAHQHIP